MTHALRLLAGLLLAAVPTLTRAADWPQWLGPNRNGASPETGLLASWPKEGPKVLWKEKGGDGYSSVAVADGRAVTLIQEDAEYAVAYDAVKGDRLWKAKIGPAFKNSYGNGPRSTPTIEGERIYVQSVTGNVACLNAKDGAIVWEKNILSHFGGKNITWGLAASPVIDGDLLYVVPGAEGAGVAALKKANGEVAWKVGSDKAAYASPQPVSVGGKKQVLFFNAAGLLAVDPAKGEHIWALEWPTEFDCNIATPLAIGGNVFVSSGEGVGSGLYELQPAAAKPLWRFKGNKSPLTTYWATAVHHDGHLYGIHGEFNKRLDLNCVELKSGKVKWSQKDFGKGALCLADGHLYLTTKKGDLVLVQATPEKYTEKSRVVGAVGETRAVPTIANGRMYVRDLQNVYCFSVK